MSGCICPGNLSRHKTLLLLRVAANYFPADLSSVFKVLAVALKIWGSRFMAWGGWI